MKNLFRLCLVTALAGCAAESIEPSPTAAEDPAIASMRQQLAFNDHHTFDVKNTLVDADGTSHLRIAQRYDGVPILGATATVNVAADGTPRELSDALARDVAIDVRARLTDREALAAVEAALHPTAYRSEPEVMLAILPIKQRVRSAARTDALRDDATRYERKITGYRLVYRVATYETGDQRDLITLVDANTGEVISQHDPDRAVANTARTLFSGTQTIDVSIGGDGFELRDPVRENNMVADGTHDSGVPWTHASSTWGDGQPFNPFTSRVTAGADAYFAMEDTFRMYNQVFDWLGVDGNGQRVIMLVHDHRTNQHDNAHYYGFHDFSGLGDMHEIGIGDADFAAGEMASIDVVAHEYTHGVDATTAGLDGDESNALNEGFSDMFGVLARIYFKRGGFAASSQTIPGTSNLDFFQLGTDITAIPGPGFALRSMTDPVLTGGFNYFFDTIGDEEVHSGDGPIDRMFFYLAQGAPSDVTSQQWSHGVPWGMDGIGNDAAGHVMFQALTRHVQSDDGYAQVRDRTIAAARDLFVQFGAEEKAVRNAFAAIDVGDPAVNAPAAPPSTIVSGDIGSEATAKVVTFDAASPIAGLRKHDFVGINRTGKDDFEVPLTCGQSTGVRVESVGTYTLAAFQGATLVATGSSDGHDLVLNVPSSVVCAHPNESIFVRVLFQSQTFLIPTYVAHFDRHS
jgi:Zn-dependent metalloprotease